MNVREAANFLSNAKELYIAWDGSLIPFDPHSILEMEAFGDYKVHSTSRERKSPHAAEVVSLFSVHHAHDLHPSGGANKFFHIRHRPGCVPLTVF